jgi:hypothetical protein
MIVLNCDPRPPRMGLGRRCRRAEVSVDVARGSLGSASGHPPLIRRWTSPANDRSTVASCAPALLPATGQDLQARRRRIVLVRPTPWVMRVYRSRRRVLPVSSARLQIGARRDGLLGGVLARRSALLLRASTSARPRGFQKPATMRPERTGLRLGGWLRRGPA